MFKVLWLSVIGLSPAFATPTTTTTAPATSHLIHLVSGPNYLPLVDEKAADGGITTAIVRKAFASQGFEIKVSYQPWVRGAEATKTATFDGTFPYVKSATREKDFLFSDMFYNAPSRLFVLKERGYKSPDDLAGKTLCSPLGYERIGYDAFIRKGQMKLVQPMNIDACFDMLALGRVDCVPISEPVGNHIISQNPQFKDKFISFEGRAQGAEYFLMVGKNHPRAQESIDIFNRGLKASHSGTATPTAPAPRH